MEKLNKMKIATEKRGITLIALVITIVVMLILAGVTINLTLGQNGIFTTAQMAAQNYTVAQEQEMAGIKDYTSAVDKIVSSIQKNHEIAGTVLKTENKINYTADGVGNIIPVPVGFSPITTADQGTKDTGFVVKNDTDGNEFVWVPVENEQDYKRIAWWKEGWAHNQTLDEATGEITREGEDHIWVEDLPTDEKESVAVYGGFYIGRYETGIKNGTLISDTNTDEASKWTGYSGDNIEAVVQKGQQPWNYITRNKAKEVSEGLYNKEYHNAKSKLCSSYAWDTALKFIETQNNTYPTTSTGGNYSIASGGTGKLQPTGYHAVNNIYDMGGNLWEWTTESHKKASPTNRGGYYGYTAERNPAAMRSAQAIAIANEINSFRITMFL